jgi:hypothetical protein
MTTEVLDIEAIRDIANKIIRIEYPLLSDHYNSYDVKCIARAIEQWKQDKKEISKNNIESAGLWDES